jgi:hypothetical protein
MRKQTLFFIAIIGLLFSNLYAQTVYITKTGEKYHEQGCRHLKKSSLSINLSEALKRGYLPCGVCKPSTTLNSTGIDKKNNSTSSNSNKPVNETSSQQCTGKTKAGSRCKRLTKSSNGLCWQHGGR